MYRKGRKWLCTILVVLMVLSGSGVEKSGPDSFLSYTSAESTSSITGKSFTLHDKNSDMCLVDLLGLKKASDNFTREGRQRKAFSLLGFLTVAFLVWKAPFFIKKYANTTEKVMGMQTHTMYCIIRYIHERGEYKSVVIAL